MGKKIRVYREQLSEVKPYEPVPDWMYSAWTACMILTAILYLWAQIIFVFCGYDGAQRVREEYLILVLIAVIVNGVLGILMTVRDATARSHQGEREFWIEAKVVKDNFDELDNGFMYHSVIIMTQQGDLLNFDYSGYGLDAPELGRSCAFKVYEQLGKNGRVLKRDIVHYAYLKKPKSNNDTESPT